MFVNSILTARITPEVGRDLNYCPPIMSVVQLTLMELSAGLAK